MPRRYVWYPYKDDKGKIRYSIADLKNERTINLCWSDLKGVQGYVDKLNQNGGTLLPCAGLCV